MSIRNTMAASEQRKRAFLQAGFLGEVDLADFLTQNDLESLSGFTAVGAGTAQINTTSNAWLKFNVNGKEIYVAKKPMRNNVNISKLATVGVIDGSKVINVNGVSFKVRLLTGTDDIITPTNIGGGEWDSLLFRVHVSHPSATRWATYTNNDLGMSGLGKNGGVCICQGRYADNPGGSDKGMVMRGYPDYVRGIWYAPDVNFANTDYGWRPVLERV